MLLQHRYLCKFPASSRLCFHRPLKNYLHRVALVVLRGGQKLLPLKVAPIQPSVTAAFHLQSRRDSDCQMWELAQSVWSWLIRYGWWGQIYSLPRAIIPKSYIEKMPYIFTTHGKTMCQIFVKIVEETIGNPYDFVENLSNETRVVKQKFELLTFHHSDATRVLGDPYPGNPTVRWLTT